MIFFIAFEIPPGVSEVSEINTLGNLVKANVSNNLITMKSQLKTEKLLQFNEKFFSNTILGLDPKSEIKSNIDYISQKKIPSKNLIQFDCVDGWI